MNHKKPSEIFEGEGSSLHQAYVQATSINQEIKNQAIVESAIEEIADCFEGNFSYHAGHIRGILESIIDRTVQMTEERIAKEVKIIADDWFSKAPKYRTKKDLLETLSLITNKSDINK